MLRRIAVEERSDVLDGKPMSEAGPYERIIAPATFEADPDNPANRIVTDIGLAPRNESGRVEYAADLYVLKPRDPQRGNRTVLFDVPNRFYKLAFLLFHRGAQFAFDPRTPEHFGDCFLLNQGYTIVWLGWQWDVPEMPGALRFYAPVATDGGKPIRGLVRTEMVTDKPVTTMSLGDSGHTPYPVVDVQTARFTVRDHGYDERHEVPRVEWRIKDGVSVEMPAGFVPGRIYELVYTSENPPVAGLGLAGIRDAVSFLRYGGPNAGISLLGDQHEHIRYALCFGASQSGRVARKFLYDGFNRDEENRPVFDGMWSHLAGPARGSFNHRFAQPSRRSDPHINFDYPTFLPPFDDSGLLETAIRDKVAPKLFLTNTSYEYWAFAASLLHAKTPSATTRIYSLTGAQHVPGPFPPRKFGSLYDTNPNDAHRFLRGLLGGMQSWVKDGTEPPPSLYPQTSDETLVPLARLDFPKIPGARLPGYVFRAREVDFGPRLRTAGIIDIEPPRTGPLYPSLVPQLDADGNETSGLRTSALEVPLATYTGWNLRDAATGAPDVLADNVGSVFPFARTKSGREAVGDPRPSIEERYPNKQDYLARLREAAHRLAAGGYLRPQDVDSIAKQAAAWWDHWTAKQP